MRKIKWGKKIDECLYQSAIESHKGESVGQANKLGKINIAGLNSSRRHVTILIPDADMKNNTDKALT